MPSHKSSKESRGRKRSKSKESSRPKTSRKKSDSASGLATEYFMKIFAPPTYSFDEDAFQATFPNVLLGIKRVVKNGNLAGYNYFLSSKNKDKFERLMKNYKKLFIKK